MTGFSGTTSDLWNHDALERIFWIELAKRRQRLEDPDRWLELRGLTADLTQLFSAKVADPVFDGSPDAFFDHVQGLESTVAVRLDRRERQALDKALDRFGDAATNLLQHLAYLRGFRLADFADAADLVELNAWWGYITSANGKRALHSTGRYSSVGESHMKSAPADITFTGETTPFVKAGEMVSTIASFPLPVRSPVRLLRRIETYLATDHQIEIDGRVLKNQAVLTLDLSRPLPPMWRIEGALRSIHSLPKQRHLLRVLSGEAQLSYEDFVEDEQDSISEDWLRLNGVGAYKAELMLDQSSFRPIVWGLYCLDLVNDGQPPMKAAGQTIEAMLGVKASDQKEPKAVWAYMKAIKQKVLTYSHDRLPWLRDQ